QLRQRHVVPRGVTDHARNAPSRSIAVDPRRGIQVSRCLGPDTGHIVVEDEDACVIGIPCPADPRVAGTERTVRHVIRNFPGRALHRLADPWAIVPVGRHDDPFLTQRMPALFPGHDGTPTLTKFFDRARLSPVAEARCPTSISRDEIHFPSMLISIYDACPGNRQTRWVAGRKSLASAL